MGVSFEFNCGKYGCTTEVSSGMRTLYIVIKSAD